MSALIRSMVSNKTCKWFAYLEINEPIHEFFFRYGGGFGSRDYRQNFSGRGGGHHNQGGGNYYNQGAMHYPGNPYSGFNHQPMYNQHYGGHGGGGRGGNRGNSGRSNSDDWWEK